MTIGIVSSLCVGLGPNGGSTPPINTAGANAIAVGLAYYNAGPTPSLGDNKGNSGYAHRAPLVTTGGAGTQVTRWSIHPAAGLNVGSGHIFTVGGTGTYATICMYALSNCDVAPYEDESKSTTPASYEGWSPGPIVPAGAGRIFLSMFIPHNIVSGVAVDAALPLADRFTLHSPIVTTDPPNYYGMYPAHFIDPGTNTKNPLFTWTNFVDPNCNMITLIPGAGGGGGGSHILYNGEDTANQNWHGMPFSGIKWHGMDS